MIKSIISSEFFKASFWVFLATGVLNIGNYIYHLLMGRMLGPELYGVLESIISFFYILTIPLVPLTLIIIKFVSAYKGKRDYGSISSLYYFFRDRLIIWGIIASAILLLLSPLIMSFLHVSDYRFSVLISLTFFVGLFSVLIKAMLQGLLKFFGLFVTNTVEIISKLIFSILLVYFGLKALGAFFAIGISGLIGLIAALYFIKKEELVKINKFTEGKEIFKYSIPVLLTSLGLTSLFTTDIILVRNLFSGIESGYYAALSVLGKIIFFGTFPVTMVLFPLISEKHAAGKDYKSILFIGITLTLLISTGIVLMYFWLPELMVSLLFGREFLAIAPLLGMFGLFIAVYSLSSLLLNFYLSIGKTIVSMFALVFSILQILLILNFHQTLLQVIQISIFVSFLLFLSLILYYPFAIKRQK